MASQQFERTDRIASEIMREVERIIREEVSDPRTDCMFSVTHVDVTRDLRYAKVFISVYEAEKREAMMKALRSAAGFIRHTVAETLNMRATPEFTFEYDDAIKRGANIFELLKQTGVTSDTEKEEQGDDEQ